jgi:hypothetical protein
MPHLPDRPPAQVVPCGGASKNELLSRLRQAGVELNDSALALFADSRFTTTPAMSTVQVAITAVAWLGFPEGATFGALVKRAQLVGLGICPLELGPHLRLALLEQPEGFIGQPQTQGRAPPGAITVVSRPLDEEEETPKGFYLRRIEGTLWLRGYRSWEGHIWSPQDLLAFAVNSVA